MYGFDKHTISCPLAMCLLIKIRFDGITTKKTVGTSIVQECKCIMSIICNQCSCHNSALYNLTMSLPSNMCPCNNIHLLITSIT